MSKRKKEQEAQLREYQRGIAEALVGADGQGARLVGVLVDSSGLSGYMDRGCELRFFDDYVVITVGDSVASMHSVEIPFSEVSSLQFGGRGVVTETHGGGWVGGGFGAKGALEGVAFASLLNMATTSQTQRMESLVSLLWSGGHHS